MRGILAATFALEGLTVSDREKALFERANPCGFILFARNIDNPVQVKELVTSLKEIVGWDCPILIDQEGGRVQRLRPPHWTDYPPANTYNDDQETLARDMDKLSQELVDLGINVDCAPVLDVSMPETHDVIGDRAYSDDTSVIIRSAETVIETFLAKDLTPFIKHLPGHGRATCDSHIDLPCVDTPRAVLSETDFVPCREISKKYSDKVWAMTAHVHYTDVDSKLPSTLSHKVLQGVIREEIGFSGFLVSDDVDMGALKQYGSAVDRSKLALEAGCDSVLYCAGKYEDMQRLADGLPPLTDVALERLEKSNRWKKQKH